MGDKASDDRMSLPEGLAQRQRSQRLVWLAKWASFGNRTEGGLRGNRIQFKPAEWAGVSGIKTDPLRAAVHWLCFPWVNYLGEMVGEGRHGGRPFLVYCLLMQLLPIPCHWGEESSELYTGSTGAHCCANIPAKPIYWHSNEGGECPGQELLRE